MSWFGWSSTETRIFYLYRVIVLVIFVQICGIFPVFCQLKCDSNTFHWSDYATAKNKQKQKTKSKNNKKNPSGYPHLIKYTANTKRLRALKKGYRLVLDFVCSVFFSQYIDRIFLGWNLTLL